MIAIQANNIVKQYKNGVQALTGMDLTVKQGEIFSLLGPNGAGKSTLINILTTLYTPTTGTITILEKDAYTQVEAIRCEIACVAQQPSIDMHLSLEENMMFQSRLYKIPKSQAKERMATLIRNFGLHQYQAYPVSSYSGGVKRRLDIALTMMSNPKILFLDEPTVGMDIQSRRSMWEMMKKIRDDFGTTIFLTTHYLEEADHLSDTICIMKDGKAIMQASPHELRSYIRQNYLRVQFTSRVEAKMHITALEKHFPQEEPVVRDADILFHVQDDRVDMEQLTIFLLEQHIPFHGIEIVEPTLEDVFLRLTQSRQEEQ